MPSASIKFTQNSPGPGAGANGQALLGVTGTLVTVANVDNTNVDKSQFELLYVPPGSALTTGVKQAYSATQTWTFTPDVTECYVVKLRVKDTLGNESVDVRVFGVVETTGRLLTPPVFGPALNVGGSVLGWLPYQRAYNKMVDDFDLEDKSAFVALTDASATIQIGAGRARRLPAATLTANRTLTLGTTGAVAGNRIRILRLDLTAFTYAIVNGGAGAGTLITYPVSKLGCGTFRFDGTNWELRSFGSL